MNSRRRFIKSAIVGTTGLGVASSAKAVDTDSSATPKVDRRKLGRTAADVSILGLGLGSSYFRTYQNRREEGEALLLRALDLGINYWDTSRGYGPSEEMIAPVLSKRREEVYLVTKSRQRDYDGFMRDVETSLSTMGVEHIDLLHMWNLEPEDSVRTIEKGAFVAIQKLLDQKVISHFGVTGHSGAQILIDVIQATDPDVVLSVYPCTREDEGRYEDELLPLARERNMGVVAMKTVKMARNSGYTGPDLVRYALSLEGVSSAIVGLDTLGHLTDNAAMATDFKPLEITEMARMTQIVTSELAGFPIPWEQPGYQDGAIV